MQNLTRAGQFARLMASIRVNTIVVNNVNADPNTLSPVNLDGLARIADVFRPYGVQLAISLYFSSPTQSIPGRPTLKTFDPLNQSVIAWWQDVADDIYQRIPDMAGYLVKANSEVCCFVSLSVIGSKLMIVPLPGPARTNKLWPHASRRS